MKNPLLTVSIATLIIPFSEQARAWYGPTCYPESTTSLTLVIPSIGGETPGDIKVAFDDNDGEVELASISVSSSIGRAHEITLKRGPENVSGIVGVMVTSPRSTTGYKFELEFRKNGSECMGAIIRTNSPSKASSPKPAAPATKAGSEKPRASRAAQPKAVAPSAEPSAIAETTPRADSLNPAEDEAADSENAAVSSPAPETENAQEAIESAPPTAPVTEAEISGI